MKNKLAWRCGDRAKVRRTASDFVLDYGEGAYEVARRLAFRERSGRQPDPRLPRGHWERVRKEVRRRRLAMDRALPTA